jgi:hypothetical protein
MEEEFRTLACSESFWNGGKEHDTLRSIVCGPCRDPISFLLPEAGAMIYPRRYLAVPVLILCVLFLGGCAVRSISDSGYPGDRGSKNPYYAGELSEMDVLGFAEGQQITEAQIQQAIAEKRDVKVRKGGPLIVIQSGAIAPDGSMMDELSKHFQAMAFSGIPVKQQDQPYSRKLRLAAAQGGYPSILCYWGTLETSQEDKATKAVSWVPVAGYFVPDETQRMRIRLRAALIDVATGRWVMLTPDPIDDSALSSGATRVKMDQKQVELLKKKSYAALVSELARYFAQ